MANIQGIIVHADGTPVIDAKITLTAKQTSCCILDNIVTTIETDNGAYAFSILPGIYSVALSMPYRYDEELGIIQVYEDSPDGTLNHYLVMAKTDLRPEALRQYEQLTQQAAQAAADASLSIQSLSSIKEATENAASEVVLLAVKAEAAALAAAQSETNTVSSAKNADVSEKAAALHVQDAATQASNAIQRAQEAALSATNAAASATQAAATAAMAATQDILTHTVPAVIEQVDTRLSVQVLRAEAAEAKAATHEEAAKKAAADALASTEPVFITPIGTIKRYIPGHNLPDDPDWVITKGTLIPTPLFFYNAVGSSEWALQHPMYDFDKIFTYGGKLKFKVSPYGGYPADAEGKDIAEVRVLLSGDVIPSYARQETAIQAGLLPTAGFSFRSTSGKLTIHDAQSGSNSPSLVLPFNPIPFSFGDTLNLTMRLKLDSENRPELSVHHKGYQIIRVNLSYVNPETLNVPLNTWCFRRGKNQAINPIRFTELESTVVHGKCNHRLTLSDVRGVFYCPEGFTGYLVLTIPDIPFPEGFYVDLLPGDNAYIDCIPENTNITIGTYTYTSTGLYRVKDKLRLIQMGKDGKTWMLI